MDGGLGLDLGREREGTGGRNSVPGGEAPLPAARRSPARGKTRPWFTVAATESTGG